MLQPIHRIPLLLLAMTLTSPFAGIHCQAAGNNPTRFYFVGLGPGDPDLMTIRAAKVIEKADVVFCSKDWSAKLADYLKGKTVHHGYWRLFPYYGRDPSEFAGEERRQCEEYAQKRATFVCLVRGAIAEGKTVAMLDGGDPLIYGPSAWALEEFEDLDPVVVPGASCFNAANAALRRCVTNGGRTNSVILTAGNWIGGDDTIEKLSAHRTTMVIFTMQTEFGEFIEKLSINYPPETPIAVVKNAGCVESEEVIESTLGKIIERVGENGPGSAYLIYVGEFLNQRYKSGKRENEK